MDLLRSVLGGIAIGGSLAIIGWLMMYWGPSPMCGFDRPGEDCRGAFGLFLMLGGWLTIFVLAPLAAAIGPRWLKRWDERRVARRGAQTG